MKRGLVALVLLITSPALAQQAPPSIAFDSVPNPLRLPHNMYFGEASGVAVNSKGHVFVLSRGNTSGDRKSTRLNSSHQHRSRMPSSA